MNEERKQIDPQDPKAATQHKDDEKERTAEGETKRYRGYRKLFRRTSRFRGA